MHDDQTDMRPDPGRIYDLNRPSTLMLTSHYLIGVLMGRITRFF